MKFRKIAFTVLITPFLSTVSYAFMCPSTFNQVNFGDTLAQVEQQCGKADKTETKAASDDNVPQQWDYYLPDTNSNNHMLIGQQQSQGTLKATFAFDAQGSLVNISVNGVGVGSTSNCGGNISIGAARKDVEAACGKPSFVNKQTPTPVAATDQKANQEVSLTYNSTPPVTLIFRNGVLAEKK